MTTTETAARYRKKPVVIEARLFDPAADYDEACAVVAWCDGHATDEGCEISTLEGVMLARPGDWIIRGVTGEFYPIKSDIFAGTYETADGPKMPPIVCLCGSTRFIGEFNRHRKALTEAGEIVLSIEVVTTQAREDDPQHADPALKARMDELHRRKIDLADYCLVVSDASGYFGESTTGEIRYAVERGKPVLFARPTALNRAREAGLLPVTADTEPDVAERVALGAVLAAPIPHASDPIARAVTAEKERIARVAEDLGASYGPGASFADVNGSLRAAYVCPACGRAWSCWWDVGAAGWPAPQPPGHRISTRAELMQDFAELRAQGLTVVEAAARLGVSPRTATRYSARLRDAGAAGWPVQRADIAA